MANPANASRNRDVRIVVNVIKSSPEMSFRFHRSFKAVVPDFATPLIIRTVPFKRRAAMKLTKFLSQFPNTLGFYENVVMVRKYAPRVYARTELFANLKNV